MDCTRLLHHEMKELPPQGYAESKVNVFEEMDLLKQFGIMDSSFLFMLESRLKMPRHVFHHSPHSNQPWKHPPLHLPKHFVFREVHVPLSHAATLLDCV